jgi:hypothetical protein
MAGLPFMNLGLMTRWEKRLDPGAQHAAGQALGITPSQDPSQEMEMRAMKWQAMQGSYIHSLALPGRKLI